MLCGKESARSKQVHWSIRVIVCGDNPRGVANPIAIRMSLLDDEMEESGKSSSSVVVKCAGKQPRSISAGFHAQHSKKEAAVAICAGDSSSVVFPGHALSAFGGFLPHGRGIFIYLYPFESPKPAWHVVRGI